MAKKKFGKKVSYIEATYQELNALVAEVYGNKDYCFVQTQEAKNDSSYTFKVEGWVNDYDAKTAEKIRTGKEIEPFDNGLVLECLCVDGYIRPGTYLIVVDW